MTCWSEALVPTIAHAEGFVVAELPRLGTPFAHDGRVTAQEWDHITESHAGRRADRLYQSAKNSLTFSKFCAVFVYRLPPLRREQTPWCADETNIRRTCGNAQNPLAAARRTALALGKHAVRVPRGPVQERVLEGLGA